jgi:hypothetical protein
VRALKILVAAGVVAVAGLGTSVPALAAVNPSIVSVTCDSCVLPSVYAVSIVANPVDTFTVHAGTATTATFELESQSVSVGPNQSASMTAPSAVGSYDFAIFVNGSFADSVVIQLTVTNDPVAPAHADGSTPQPIVGLQQVGVPASGDCADVPVTVGHDQGFPIGGWSKTWANWINNGTGGPVCTRTVEEIPNGPGTYRLVVDP